MVDYKSLLKELAGLLEGERDYIANAANCSAFIFENIPDLNWVGFYFLRSQDKTSELVVGPFQGKIACTRIGLDRGVCGEAFSKNKIMNIPDVEEFEDHIVCDDASVSELALPLFKDGKGIGVFDIDSPELDRFDGDDEKFFVEVSKMYLQSCNFI